MDCQRYKGWIGDAAHGALDDAREIELGGHLSQCASCRADLERERLLLAAIDQGISDSIAGELSPQFAANVRQRLASEGARPQPGFIWWGTVVVGALAGLVLAVVWFGYHPTAQRPPATTQALKQNAPLAANPASTARLQSPILPAHPPTHWQPARKPRRPRSAPAAPEVLIDKREREAVAQLFKAIREGRVDLSSLLAMPPGFSREPDGSLTAMPLEIHPVEIAKLKWELERGEPEPDRSR